MQFLGRALPAAAIFFAAAASFAGEPAPRPSFITVTLASGETSVIPAGSTSSQGLLKGAWLREGDVVQTGPVSRLEVMLVTTGTIVRLGPRTRLELREAPLQERSLSARLFFGNLWAKVNKLVAGQRFEVETQNAVAGVRGTELRVAAAPSGASLLRVYEGTVLVRGAKAGWTRAVTPGAELRWDAKGQGPLRRFELKAERSSFMRWVRRREREVREREAREHDSKDKPRGEHSREKSHTHKR